jgi:hypothetical protein
MTRSLRTPVAGGFAADWRVVHGQTVTDAMMLIYAGRFEQASQPRPAP